MKHLAANKIVEEIGRDQYAGTTFSKATTDPTIAAGLIYTFEGMAPLFHTLPDFLAKTDYQVPANEKNGPIQLGWKTSKPFYGYLQENARLGNAFNEFIVGYTRARPCWADYYPCEERLTATPGPSPLLVDVGGGLGHDIANFYAKYPGLAGQLVLQDTPSVIAQVNQGAMINLPPAIKRIAHDFFSPQPVECRGAQVYLLRQILHNWPDDQCKTILSHIRDAMTPKYSKLLIGELVVSEVGAPWQQTTVDWCMMAMFVSRERTECQWRELLAAVGLKICGIWQQSAENESVIEAVLTDD